MSEPDVVVIGAGAGGLAAAWRLASRGVRVTVLEAGKHYLPLRDYPQTEDDFELHPFPYDPVRDEEGNPRYSFGSAQEIGAEWKGYRSWNRGQGRFVPGDRRSYQQYAHVQGVGGSTLHFQGEAHRFHPRSLRMRSLFGVACDWPLAYDELAHYYDLAETCMGVAAPKDNPFRPRKMPPVLPEHPLSWASRKLIPAFADVGATLMPNSLAILSRPYRGRPPCNLCDSCTNGCPLGDKGSADVTFLPPALATGRLDLKTETHALALETGSDGKISGVVYQGPDGVEKRARAKWFIAAGGAIETPRLLLASQSSRFPHGVGNGEGQVGRNFTETLAWTSVALLPERVDSYRGLPVDGVAWNFAVPSSSKDGWVGGFRLSAAHGEEDLRGPVAYATRLIEGFGPAHERRLREVFGHAVAVSGMGD
ncbi:MAG TPA: GMC family oxidoreductase, partial [Thermoanaerobaculia bacterium]|nr:GMC family oxidoreductase [Thermoanaerobaculia bacterium]